jgi:hypothetical protein
MAKLPDPDVSIIASKDAAYAPTDAVLWRIHAPTGAHPIRWDALRRFGPLPTARFDPWSPPARDRSGDSVTRGVGYFAFDIPACLAEVFQTTRHISTTRGRLQLSAFEPVRSLNLLDLRSGWPIEIGSSHALNSGPKNRCRTWAEAIRGVHSTTDGLLYIGMAGRDCVVLFEPPGGVIPITPSFTKPLADPGLASRIADAAGQIGYALD